MRLARKPGDTLKVRATRPVGAECGRDARAPRVKQRLLVVRLIRRFTGDSRDRVSLIVRQEWMEALDKFFDDGTSSFKLPGGCLGTDDLEYSIRLERLNSAAM